MLNLKKVIASICVIAMVLTTVAFGATYTDVAEGSVYYEAVETLTKLDIVEGFDGEYRPEDGVTRAEMAALIARIQGYGETAKGSANTAFTDVPSTHWASGYIANAAGMGIINGYGDGTFGPEDPVLYEQAIKMVMATLGYTPYAEKNGGYPTGYLAAAQRYDVSLAVANAAVGQAANRGTVAQILVNALDTSLMIQSYWDTDGKVGYEIADGIDGRAYRTLMSENLGYVKIRGVVVENSITDIDVIENQFDTTKAPTVRVEIYDAYKTTNKDFASLGSYVAEGEGEDAEKVWEWNEREILVGGTDVEEYLGQSVIGYLKQLANEKYEFVSVAVDTNRNDVLTINLADFAGVDSDEIDYFKNTNEKTVAAKLAYTNIPMVFNGTGGYNTGDIEGIVDGTSNIKFGGEIVLIDNDTAKGYDIAFLNVAKTAVVKKVDENGINLYESIDIVGGDSTSTIYVNPDDETKLVAIYKDGVEIEYTELNEWDILSVYAASSSANVIKANVIGAELIGTITSTKASKTSADDLAYRIDGNWYDLAEGAYEEGIEISAGGKFYIDEFGKIAAFIEDAALAGGAVGNYGYVMGVEADKEGFGTNVEISVQLLTKEGVKVYTVKNNAKFNGVQIPVKEYEWVEDNDISDYHEGLSGLNDNGEVVKYTVDSNGNISSIVTQNWAADEDIEPAFKAAGVAGDFIFDADTFRLTEDAEEGDKFYVTEDAIVFVVGDIYNSVVATAADFADKNEYNVIAAYTLKNEDDKGIVVVDVATFAGAAASANLAIVTDWGKTSDDDNNEILEISFLQNGEKFTMKTTADAYDDCGAVKIGDALKIKTSGKLIVSYEKAFKATSSDIRFATQNDIAESNVVNYVRGDYTGNDEDFDGGKVIDHKKGTVKLESGEEYKLGQAKNVYTINTRSGNVVVQNGGSFNAIDALYEDEYVSYVIRNAKGEDKTVNYDCADAQAFADYVYVRTYEDKVVDVIIVKSADIRVKGSNDAVYVPEVEEE